MAEEEFGFKLDLMDIFKRKFKSKEVEALQRSKRLMLKYFRMKLAMAVVVDGSGKK